MSGTCWQVLKEVEWKWGFLISTYCTRCLEFFRTGMATTAGTLSLKISWGSDTPRFDVRGVRQQGWLMDQNQVNWRWWKGSIENNQLFSKFLLVVKHDCILYSRKGFSQSSAETWCHFLQKRESGKAESLLQLSTLTKSCWKAGMSHNIAEMILAYSQHW